MVNIPVGVVCPICPDEIFELAIFLPDLYILIRCLERETAIKSGPDSLFERGLNLDSLFDLLWESFIGFAAILIVFSLNLSDTPSTSSRSFVSIAKVCREEPTKADPNPNKKYRQRRKDLKATVV